MIPINPELSYETLVKLLRGDKHPNAEDYVTRLGGRGVELTADGLFELFDARDFDCEWLCELLWYQSVEGDIEEPWSDEERTDRWHEYSEPWSSVFERTGAKALGRGADKHTAHRAACVAYAHSMADLFMTLLTAATTWETSVAHRRANQ